MPYGFNDNTYEVLKNVRYRDIFDRVTRSLRKGDHVGSAIVNQLIVDEDTTGLEGQPYIDKMVELGYVDIVL